MSMSSCYPRRVVNRGLVSALTVRCGEQRRRRPVLQERVDERRLGQRVDLLGERLERRRVARSRGRAGWDGARGRILIVAEREPETHAQALQQRGGQTDLANDARIVERIDARHSGADVDRLAFLVEVEQ